ncbi:nickel pincer cofactor biosynthesis protein LarC [Actinophytocola sp.]|uniref:nickel pincer cofactor biosynthesis protein LarC n=1 Tax=Actinophytocola sp. TaxID=1872138 RepID=UPI002D6E8CD9|nr:nickel pincer cofactor biosynthesis protein LarC [Actinophytocola sp.]HYQ68198.1 nickel pincer cofactor biosynthesis protein LarC [Actinophytocola sp.]
MICWLNPASGLAGDMLLAGLIDAGAPVAAIRAAVAATGLTGWELGVERVVEHGLTATRVTVTVTDTATTRHAAELIALAAAAPAPVAEVAVRALTAIAETEAALHGTDPGSVHLHELGGHDTIVDVVGVAAALHALDVTDVYCAPLPLGTGAVRTAHGVLPCPAPATLALLAGATTTGTDLRGETVTPTAAALVRALPARFEAVPVMRPVRTGYGAGHRRLADRPNVVAVTLAEPAAPATRAVLLETTVDDVTGETLGHTVSKALAAGALDAWLTAVTMKKGRPGHVVSVLAPASRADALATLVLTETGSLGLRRSTVDRDVLPRRFETVHVDGHPVRVKIGPYGAKPEHDDVAAVAARLGLPLREVAARARREIS